MAASIESNSESKSPPAVSHRKKLYFSGDTFFNDIIASIENSQSEVLTEFYIFDLDRIGFRVLEAMTKAAKRGVRVSLLVDGFGSFMSLLSLGRECQSRGISFAVYHPIWKLSGRIYFTPSHLLNRWRRYSERSNKRTHRKIVLIDQQSIFIGSYNISECHSEEFSKLNVWRDTGLALFFENSTLDLGLEFTRRSMREAFALSRFNRRSYLTIFRRIPLPDFSNADPWFRINSTLRMRRLLVRDMLTKIKNSKDHVLITNAYFLPRRKIIRALRMASERGIEVTLCVPQRTDAWIVREASRLLYYKLLKSNVKIYEYLPTVLHAKTMIIDKWVTIGSQNLNHRSLLHDLEIEIGTADPEIYEACYKQWLLDISKSEKITLSDLGRFGMLRRMLARIILFFRYFI